jgi:hypothetical protein
MRSNRSRKPLVKTKTKTRIRIRIKSTQTPLNRNCKTPRMRWASKTAV